MNTYQIAWACYVAGGLGCGLAAWLLFRRFGRAWGHFFMVTVWVLLLTPYAMDAEQMIMAPAVVILVMEFLINGFDSVKPIAMLLTGVWLVALIVSLGYQLLTRRFFRTEAPAEYHDFESASGTEVRKTRRQPRDYQDPLNHEESLARRELLDGEIPLRAER